jgi:hypothetical protein
MLKKAASGVLASLRGSTYRGEPPGYRNHWWGFSVRQDPFKGRTARTKCGRYLLASSLAAALLDGIFEHPARCSLVVPGMQAVKVWPAYLVFPQHARGVMKMPPGS